MPVTLPDELLNLGDNRDNLRRLVEQIRTEQGVVPFVGDELLAPLGFPIWREFLREQGSRLVNSVHLMNLLDSQSYSRLAELLVTERRIAFFVAFQKAYDSSRYWIEPITGAISHLPNLSDIVITSTLDATIEALYSRKNRPFLTAYNGKKVINIDIWDIYHSIIRINGKYDDIDSCVLTVDDVYRAYGYIEDRPFQNSETFESAIFNNIARIAHSLSLVFVGYSFDLKHFNEFFTILANDYILPKHFAIVRTGQIDEEALYSRGTYPIWYPDNKEVYVELILSYLAEQRQEFLHPSTGQALPTTSRAVSSDVTAEPVPPDALIEACASGQCALFTGSGVGATAGLLTWKKFVQDLAQWAKEQQILSPELNGAIDDALLVGEVNTVADLIVDAVHDNQRVANFLKHVFQPAGTQLSNVHRMLATLPFSAVLTTNFDDLIDHAFAHRDFPEYTPDDASQLLEAISQNRFFLLKLYGTTERPETLMVAPAQYQQAIADNPLFGNAIESLFVGRTLLFLGVSLEGIEDYLAGIRFKSRPNQEHYALVNVENGAWKVKADQLKRRYGINVIHYQATEGFPEVERFVQKLQEGVTQKSLQAGTDTTTTEPARLTKITVENIGPFATLELAIQPSWQVLLGDNGLGKSSILKAIALAACGEEGRAYALRLLREGASHATITLETNKGTKYITQVFRRDTECEIVSRPTRYAESLVLGFPALRGITWTRSTSPGDVQKRPTVADALPLLKDGMDARLDQLKQWLLHLDHQIQADKNYGMTTSPSESLRNRFFEIVKRLTPGVDVQYVRTNPQTGTITIRTNDGELPIEAISQGTASLLGWIGVLLQRLYDIYEGKPDPLQEYALVLIDEIDAHMHPFWQQYVVPAIRETFPNVQFIATTHSPLIVGDLAPNEIIVLDRDIDTNVIQANIAEESVTSLRADQILTSPLFNLRSARSIKHQDMVQKYAELLSKPDRTPEENEELRSQREYLKTNMRVGDDSPTASGVLMSPPEVNGTEPSMETTTSVLTEEQQRELAEKEAYLFGSA